MHPALALLLTAASCGCLVLAAEPVVIRLLRRAAVMDAPNARSSHSVPTPRGGGAPIVVALVLSAVAWHGPGALPFALAVTMFAAIGLADDLRGLSAVTRLGLQAATSLAAAVLLVAGPGWAWHGAHWPAPTRFAVMAAAAVLVAAVLAGFVNAFNFMDGINGISGAHALAGGAAFAAMGWLRHELLLTWAGCAIAACGLAFLPWNAVRARVFLGDVGSYGIGAALGVLAVSAVLSGIPPEASAAPLALYLADTAWTLQRRIRAGEPWLEAHRSHAYQQLCDVGWSHVRVMLVTAGLTVVLCSLGMASLSGLLELRIGADACGLALLALYLRAPAVLQTALQPEAA